MLEFYLLVYNNNVESEKGDPGQYLGKTLCNKKGDKEAKPFAEA